MQRMIGNICATIKGELPQRKHPVLLCLGSGPGGQQQAQEFLAHTPADVAACNDAITAFPGVLHLAVSLHAELLEGWVQRRMVQEPRPCVVGEDLEPGVDVMMSIDRACGSSGMYLALLGGLMGYERIVLAGITLEREKELVYRDLWRAAKKKGALANVETLAASGWLAELLKARP
ncbi:MAG: hypothetical protein KKF77_03420 [Proteobacteria bacterium]|nr:hypothetical protein [Pseudomonadota bacterium]